MKRIETNTEEKAMLTFDKRMQRRVATKTRPQDGSVEELAGLIHAAQATGNLLSSIEIGCAYHWIQQLVIDHPADVCLARCYLYAGE